LFDNKDEKCPFRAGEWVIIRTNDKPAMHCRVSDTSLFPSVKVAESVKPAVADLPVGTPYYPGGQQTATPAAPAASKPINEFRPATFAVYNQNFDDLHDFHKREAIYAMLDILPTVTE
jgi:ubiquitin-conjugating enzyme E2 Q